MGKKKLFQITGILLLVIFPVITSAQQTSLVKAKDQESASGLQDRKYWYTLLYRISYPVVHNLAEQTLKKNLPLELGPGYSLDPVKVTYLEAVGRTVAGLAPWLALPDDDSEEGVLRAKLKKELLKGLSNAVNPLSPDYLNFRTEHQPLVDAAFLAHAFIRAPKAIWDPLDEITKKRFIEEFKSLRNRKPAYSNWLLFAAITECFLLSIGESYDPFRIDMALKKMNEWYAGDGWYNDGNRFGMDYYNSFVIHPMLVDVLKITADKKISKIEEYEISVKRMVRYAEFLERVISPEGTFPPFGRSITYRTGAFQALAQTVLLEKLPAFLKPSQVRSGLTSVMHSIFDNPANFDSNGWLVLGFNGHQPMVADTYTSTGSLYLTTLSFLPLGLPATNSFWMDAPADWTSKKAWSGQPFKKDYKVEY